MAAGFQGGSDISLDGRRGIPESHYGESQAGGLAVGDLEIVVSEPGQRRQDGLERSSPLSEEKCALGQELLPWCHAGSEQ